MDVWHGTVLEYDVCVINKSPVFISNWQNPHRTILNSVSLRSCKYLISWDVSEHWQSKQIHSVFTRIISLPREYSLIQTFQLCGAKEGGAVLV